MVQWHRMTPVRDINEISYCTWSEYPYPTLEVARTCQVVEFIFNVWSCVVSGQFLLFGEEQLHPVSGVTCALFILNRCSLFPRTYSRTIREYTCLDTLSFTFPYWRTRWSCVMLSLLCLIRFPGLTYYNIPVRMWSCGFRHVHRKSSRTLSVSVKSSFSKYQAVLAPKNKLGLWMHRGFIFPCRKSQRNLTNSNSDPLSSNQTWVDGTGMRSWNEHSFESSESWKPSSNLYWWNWNVTSFMSSIWQFQTKTDTNISKWTVWFNCS